MLPESRRKWRTFGLGLSVRLLGLLLIWLGDGSDHAFRKALVVVGVILSIGGIAVLRWMLFSGLRAKKKVPPGPPRADASGQD